MRRRREARDKQNSDSNLPKKAALLPFIDVDVVEIEARTLSKIKVINPSPLKVRRGRFFGIDTRDFLANAKKSCDKRFMTITSLGHEPLVTCRTRRSRGLGPGFLCKIRVLHC